MRVVVGVFTTICRLKNSTRFSVLKNRPKSVASTVLSKLNNDDSKGTLVKRLVKCCAVCVLCVGFRHDHMRQI